MQAVRFSSWAEDQVVTAMYSSKSQGVTWRYSSSHNTARRSRWLVGSSCRQGQHRHVIYMGSCRQGQHMHVLWLGSVQAKQHVHVFWVGSVQAGQQNAEVARPATSPCAFRTELR